MKRLWVLGLLAAGLVCADSALAQGKLKAEGVYLGGSAGAGLTKLDIDNVDLLDDTSLAWKAVVGFRSRYFAVEFDYRSLQEVNSVIPGSEITAKTKGFTGSALLILPVGPVDIFGRAGGFRATSTIGIADNITETKEWALVYGGGLGLRVGSFTLRVEYERPQLEAIEDLHLLMGGFTIAF